MTETIPTTATLRIVRADCWKTRFERDMYGGRMVEPTTDRTDSNGSRAYRMLEGPLYGTEIWFTDDQLGPYPREISTEGEQ